MAKKIAFITGNRGKYREIRALAEPYGIDVDMLDLSPPEIQADSLEEVALFSLTYLVDTGKAKPTSNAVKVNNKEYHALFLEDSGLFIDGFGGFPGVYSAYVFKTLGNEGILRLMEGMKDRRAHFKSVIGLLYIQNGDGVYDVVAGMVKGVIAEESRGEGGFGYDPIFIPEGRDKTFAQDPEMKNEISHRARATEAMIKALNLVVG